MVNIESLTAPPGIYEARKHPQSLAWPAGLYLGRLSADRPDRLRTLPRAQLNLKTE